MLNSTTTEFPVWDSHRPVDYFRTKFVLSDKQMEHKLGHTECARENFTDVLFLGSLIKEDFAILILLMPF